MKRILLAISFSLILSPIFSQSPSCPDLIWYDEFDGTSLDPTKWSYDLQDGCQINLCGWGNGELQWYQEENVSVADGKLKITAKQESVGGKNYTSARIKSLNKGDFKFGRIEASIKPPQGSGFWPAFWLLPTEWVYGGWPYGGEVDIMEFDGRQPNKVWGTLHFAAPTHKYVGKEIFLPAGQKFSDAFHEVAIEWDSTSISWYMDGTLYHHMNNLSVMPGSWAPFQEKFHMILNLAIGGLGGQPNTSTVFPSSLEVDYVRVYSRINRKIQGRIRCLANESSVEYRLPGDPSGTYEWTVTNGTIVDGQGTNKIKVDWGTSTGTIHLKLTNSCGIFEFNYTVYVVPDQCNLTFNNIESIKYLTLLGYNGSYSDDYNNPNKTNTVNTSSKVVFYRRNQNVSNDSITYGNVPLGNITEYESGEKIFYLDVYSDLATTPGTKIQIELQNSMKAKGAYPAGRRSLFTAYTTKKEAWERLAFKFDSIVDPGTLATDVDNVILRFAPAQNSPGYFYFDNFSRGSVEATEITGSTSVDCDGPDQTYSIPVRAGSTYIWSVPANAIIKSGQNSETISVDWGNTSGYVNVLETNSAGCQSISAQLNVDVTCIASTNPQNELNALSMYPNPVEDHVKIDFESASNSGATIKVYNLFGEIVYADQITGSKGKFKTVINTLDLSKGIYLVEIKTTGEVSRRKFIKN